MKTSTSSAFLRKLLVPLCAVILPALLVTPANAQVPIAPGSSVSENFSSLGTSGTATLPSGWRASKSANVREVTAYSTAVTATERAGGAGLTSSAGNGIYNFGSSDTDRAVGGLSSSSASKSVNVYVALQNTGASGIASLSVSYNAERYRNGSNTAGFSIQLYYSTDGTTWTSAGGSFLSSFAANADNNGSATVPIQTIAVTAQNLPVAIPAGSTLYLAWNYSVTSGTTTSNAQALGVSDIQITAVSASTAPSITSFSPSSGLVGDTVTINGSNFGAAPGVKFNGIAAFSEVNGAGTVITATVPSGATTGPITVEVAGEPTATSATDFTVLAPNTPIINLSTNSISGLSTSVGVASAATNYVVTGTNLGTTAVTITPSAEFLEVGTNGTDFASTIDLSPTDGAVSNTVFLRVAATNLVTNYTATISHVSGSASNSLAVSGAITNLPPVLTVSTNTLSGFTTTTNVASAAQTFTVTGANLTTNVAITAPAGYEVADDGNTFGPNISLVPVSGSTSAEISVRLAASVISGPRSGSVTVDSAGAPQRTVALSGSVAVPNIPGLVYWNFDTATPTSGTGGDYAAWSFPGITQNNNNGTTTLLTTTSASSGYTNLFNVVASGTTNAGAAARTGALNTNAGGSAFFEIQVVVPSNTFTSITNVSFGSRSTSTGPAAFAIRSSTNNFATDVVTNALATNSSWAMYSAPVDIALTNGTNTLRIYGFNGTGSASTGQANWRIDDLTLALAAGEGPLPPSNLSYSPSSANGVVGTAILSMIPTMTGEVDAYSIDPALPAGLSINPTTGVISGTPSVAAASANYTITASNGGGSTTAQVTIAIQSVYGAWAGSYGLNPTTDGAPSADPDSDGLDNNAEYAFGTNPTVATASLLTTSGTGGNFTVTWLERSGVTYNVQSTVNLATTAFANDGTIEVANGPSDPAPPSGYTRKQFTVPSANNKFFRIRALVE